MQRVRLLGHNGNISVLWQKAVLRRNVFTMEEHVKGNGVPCLTMGDREQEEKILQPVAHTLQIPGKQHLVKLASAYNYWLKVPADKLTVVKDIEHAFHYSLLLIDDIEDNSVLRRGIPVAHSIYGVPSTTNASIYLMLKGVKRALSLNHPDAIALCIEQLLDMYYGQGLEIYWRENNTCPSFEEYKQLIQRKLASLLFRVRLMQLVSDNKTDFTKLNRIMQLYWQIRDDYCNLCMQQYTNERGYCDDISEGKFSFPIIHAILNNPDDQQVINILRKQTQDVKLKKHCMTLLEKFGSFSFTRHTLEELDAEARAEIAKHGGNPVLENVLNEMLDWKKNRDDKNPEQ